MSKKYPKPKGPLACGMCGDIVYAKDLMWHEGLGGNWIHRKCYEEWKAKRNE
jgi:hypothetical protein